MKNFFLQENEHKRKNSEDNKEDPDFLALSLATPRQVRARQQNPQPPLSVNTISPSPVPSKPQVADVESKIATQTAGNHNQAANVDVNTAQQRTRSGRVRRSPSQGPAQGKSETIVPPFPWATDRRAYVHNRNHLVQNKILTITGTVQCKRCEKKFEMAFNLEEKLTELCMFIQKNKATMHDRAPRVWVDPVLPKCEYCGQENSVRPFLGDTKKKEINWLFLLLGQMLGCCTLDQLKYFCKHTKSHRTGAKDRVLYSTYMGLCKQIVPEWVI